MPLHVVVIVLGDVGRSPRMQYHTLSLLEAGHTVTLIGYQGEDILPALKDFPLHQLHIVRFADPKAPTYLPKVFYFLWRIIALTYYLIWAFVERVIPKEPKIDCLVVQNPPALPLLLVAYCFCRVYGGYQQQQQQRKRPGLVIDWHNLGYSMLRPGIIRRLARYYEILCAPLADGHLTVTQAMKVYLGKHMKVTNNIQVLYDCPPSIFQPLSLQQQHEFLQTVKIPQLPPSFPSWDASYQTVWTECVEGQYRPRKLRPALITSSTSWTEDEDFGVLLDALSHLDAGIRGSALRIVVLVTGKGPLQEYYEHLISKLRLDNICIQTMWLSPAEYPQLLACADVGVSLHTSTSGLDLPMKILDLFGCGTPVVARQYECLDELVKDNIHGRTFDTSQQLSTILLHLLEPLYVQSNAPCHGFGDLAIYSKNLEGRTRWKENWMEHAWPVIQAASHAYDP